MTNEQKVQQLYEHTYLTMEKIGSMTGNSLKVVGTYIRKAYPKDFQLSRKKECYSRSKQGDKNPAKGKHPTNYIGECSDGKGYLTIYKPVWYTGRIGSERVFVHSVVMCEALGLTEIPKGFVVHHVDHNPLNNDLNNLCLMLMGAHTRLHCRERATTRRKP